MNKVEIKSDVVTIGAWKDFSVRTLVVIEGTGALSEHLGKVCIIPLGAGLADRPTLVSLCDGATWVPMNTLRLRKLPVGTKVEITVCDED